MISAAPAGLALAFLALVIFSTNTILVKVASARLGINAGYLISIAVNVIFAALLFGVELAARSDSLRWSWWGVGQFVAAGAFTTYLGRWFNFEAITRLGPARASLFQVSSPLFTVLIAWIVLGERLHPAAIGAMLLTIAGLVLVSMPAGLPAMIFASGTWRRSGRTRPTGGKGVTWHALLRSGLVLGMTSSAAYAAGNVFRGGGIRAWDEPILGALLGAVTGLMLQLLLGRGVGAVIRALPAADRRGAFLFALGGVMTIVGQACVIASMRLVPVAVVALITLCTPILVFPLSYFVLGNKEGIRARTVAGAVLTLAGIGMLVLQ